MVPPFDDDALLSTEELSAAFSSIFNLSMSAATLETRRSRGGGPPYEKYGKYVRYRWGTARTWMLGKRRAFNNTSENTARPPP
jgi:hypothetical protein